MHKHCFAVSVAGLVTIASALAQAQGPDTLSAAQRAGVALARLGGGQRVRIRARGVGLVEGRVVTSSPSLVALRTDGSKIEVPATGLDSLWVRGGGHAGKGALIGAGVVGLALGAVTVTSTEFCGTTGVRCGPGARFAQGLLLGGALGSAIGALIGALVPKWQLRVP
jgi:hypothetical protein